MLGSHQWRKIFGTEAAPRRGGVISGNEIVGWMAFAVLFAIIPGNDDFVGST